MKVVELKEDIRDTSIIRDIFDVTKISQQLSFYTEFITDINYTDFKYVQILLDKSKTMLYTVNYLLEQYFQNEYKKAWRNLKLIKYKNTWQNLKLIYKNIKRDLQY